MSLSSKLNTLSEVDTPERLSLLELKNKEGYKILSARQHVHQTFGPSIIIEVEFEGETRICFLPKRYGLSLSPSEVTDLGGGDYKIKCTGLKNKSPILDIFKTQ